MDNFEKYMVFVAFVGSFVFYSQAYKIFKTGKAKDVSLFGFITSLFTSINWSVYGFYKEEGALIFSGCLCTFGSVLVLLGIFICTIRNKNQKGEQ